jgi:gluconolactonase
VQVVAPDGMVRWLTRDPIAPNDLCLGPDGLLYVTDPTRRPSRDDGRLWRCDPETGEAEMLLSVPWYPNGIGFGPEDDALYVASTGEREIKRFPLLNGRLGRPEVVIRMERGHPDGFAFDADGNLIVCAVSMTEAPGELQTWSPNGRLLDVLRPGPGRRYTNAALSADRVLIVTDSDGGRVLAFDSWPTAGLPLHPFRA